MSFFLVCPELQFTLELPLTPSATQQLQRQIERLQVQGDTTRFELRLADQIGRILPEAVDWDIKSPTQAQMALAHTLCNQLGVPLASGALESRYEMYKFIAHMSALKAASKDRPFPASKRKK